MAARLKEKFHQEIVPTLMKDFHLKTVMAAPRLVKIVLNVGVGEAALNAKALDAALADLTAVAGQKPVITRARQSIAGFKIRQGMAIGAMVTLRGDRMYEFLDRLINLALPRIRDFRGVSRRSFDGRGNYSIGLREQIVFPEINYDKVDKIRGLEVAIVTTAPDDAQGYALLRAFGMPFQD
ncbi:MAG: 50S ribosomal protein L5 [Chloroflexaceae bacterium]|nr:50S ribosomal protein L5 [Chloroflexaceae bacterium]